MRSKHYAEKTPLERKISYALFEQRMLRLIARARKQYKRRVVSGGCVVLTPRCWKEAQS
jgi:hypothetical protein